MKRANISELKNQLSKYLRIVKTGETVVIFERNLPIAEIRPRPRSKTIDIECLDELERQGIVRRGNLDGLGDFLKVSKLSGKDYGVLDALLEERHENER